MSTIQGTLELEPADEQSLNRSKEIRDELHGRVEDDSEDENHGVSSSQTDEDDNDEPMEVGGVFTVELNYSARHVESGVIAYSEHEAKEIAEDSVQYGSFWEADLVHTDVRKNKTVYEDDEEADEIETW